MPRRAIIIGAGITGISIAHALIRDGFLVTVFDAASPGSGTTSAALGSLTPYSDHACAPATRTLAQHSVELYPSWLLELQRVSGIEVDYAASGLLQLAFSEPDIALIEEAYASLQECGCRTTRLNGRETLELEPSINKNVLAALHLLDEPFLDTDQLFRACVATVRSLGGEIVHPRRVERIAVENGRATGIQTADETIAADIVILAAGVACAELAIGFSCPLVRVRGEVIEIKGTQNFLGRHLYCEPGFITPRRDGRLLLGSTYEEQQNGDNEDRTTIKVSNAASILNAARQMLPGIDDFQVTRCWKGWRPKSPDGQPIIGRTPIEGLLVATGLFGLGITLAPAVAEMISSIASERIQDAPPEFSATRFQGI